MRIFISTGEVSGDLQGSLLVTALYRQAKEKGIDLEILALGGEQMADAGAKLLGETTRISSIGIIEVLPDVIPTWHIQQQTKRYLKDNPPDLLILIDYLGPNLSIGRYVRAHLPHVPIIYYIAPQAWVWSPNDKNTQQIIDITDRLLAIFPDEARFFADKGLSVTWVGHPLLDRMASAPSREQARQAMGISPDQKAIVLLPASRKQELNSLLPLMCEAAKQIQSQLLDVQFWLPLSLQSYRSKIEAIISQYDLPITIVEGKTLEAIAAADLAIAKSGTVNLEVALLNVPQVVIYRVNKLTMWIARKFLKFSIPFMSPVNLMVNREIVPELFQEAATPERIVQESIQLLTNAESRQKTLHDYQQMRINLGEVGVCDRAAAEILQMIGH